MEARRVRFHQLVRLIWYRLVVAFVFAVALNLVCHMPSLNVFSSSASRTWRDVLVAVAGLWKEMQACRIQFHQLVRLICYRLEAFVFAVAVDCLVDFRSRFDMARRFGCSCRFVGEHRCLQYSFPPAGTSHLLTFWKLSSEFCSRFDMARRFGAG